MRGPKPRYEALIRDGALEADPAQSAAVDRLQDLHDAVRSYCKSRRGVFRRLKSPPRGLYLWGGVGRGKTLLMDLFANNTDIAAKRRVHFHEFMGDVHNRIGAWRALSDDAKRRHPGANRRRRTIRCPRSLTIWLATRSYSASMSFRSPTLLTR